MMKSIYLWKGNPQWVIVRGPPLEVILVSPSIRHQYSCPCYTLPPRISGALLWLPQKLYCECVHGPFLHYTDPKHHLTVSAMMALYQGPRQGREFDPGYPRECLAHATATRSFVRRLSADYWQLDRSRYHQSLLDSYPQWAAWYCLERKEGVAHGITKRRGSAKTPPVFVGAKGLQSVFDILANSLPILPNRSALPGSGHDMWSSKREVRVCWTCGLQGTGIGGKCAYYLL